jgi:hypothetical protein
MTPPMMRSKWLAICSVNSSDNLPAGKHASTFSSFFIQFTNLNHFKKQKNLTF